MATKSEELIYMAEWFYMLNCSFSFIAGGYKFNIKWKNNYHNG